MLMYRRMALSLHLALAVVPAAQCVASVKKAEAKVASPTLIIPSDARIELLWTGGTWLESPAVAPTGEIFFSDMIEVKKPGKLGVIRVYDPRTGQTRLFQSPSGGSNGLQFDDEGRLLAAHGAVYGSRNITRTDLSTNLTELIAGLYGGHVFNSPNDIAIDKKGRIYFTDPRYSGHEKVEQPVMGVYRVDLDKTVHLVVSDIVRPNGIAISPDERSLYVAQVDPLRTPKPGEAPAAPSSGMIRILRYDLTDEGVASNMRILKDYAGTQTVIDGIKTDSGGNLYIAESSATPGIRVLSPPGQPVTFVPTPENAVNLTLAQVGSQSWLYITSPTSLFRIRMNPQ